jgi:hypothetical protein
MEEVHRRVRCWRVVLVVLKFRGLLPKSLLIRNVGCKDGRWKELAEGCLVKDVILAVMNLCLSAARHLVNWSCKQTVINENIRGKSVCYEYRASSNVGF